MSQNQEPKNAAEVTSPPSVTAASATDRRSAVSTKPRRLVVAVLLLLGCGYAATQFLFPKDIRPDALRHALTPDAVRQGRRLLGLLDSRYGGSERYRHHRVTQVEYTDAWASGLMQRVGSPWLPGERLRLTFAHGTDSSRLDFLSGPRQSQSWGIQQWQTYTVASGQRKFAPNKDIKFWLPTLEYFLEMPFRVGEAEIVAHAGERTLGNQIYDLIFLTWGSPTPHRHMDQYVLWIRRSDGILEFAEYTVRDVAPFIVGCIHYEDLRDVDGILVPFRLTLGDCPGKPGLLHRQTLSSAQFRPDLPIRDLVPEPDRRADKAD